jgi:hypothetical protein
MFGYDSNFIEPKDLALAIVTECDAMTWTIILLKGWKYPPLPGHMISASTI